MICMTCNTDKDLDLFPVQRQVASSRGSGVVAYRKHCKACTAERARAFRLANPGYKGSGKVTKYPVEMRKVVSMIANRVQDAKSRAKSAFDIDTDFMYDLAVAQDWQCALSGILLGTKKCMPHVMSIDQIDAGQGYVRGNVQWVSWAVNRAKGDLSMGELKSMCTAILRRCNDYP
uniref:Uncharacterized protein n=4 Tax=unclassified bacterial viruses TaxID=12333 RepID=A0AAU6W0Q0_9VIRU